MHALAPVAMLFWPTLNGLLLGAHHTGHPLRTGDVLVCLAGAFLMRSAGCVWNDWTDRRLDPQVQRTASRPLAAGDLAPAHALGVLAGLLGLCSMLLFFMNPFSAGVALAAIPLVILYPFTKRWTFWPQVVLGCVWNHGLLVGFALSSGTLSWRLLPLWGFWSVWTILYDTVYAYQDAPWDKKAGIRSAALALGAHPFPVFMLWYTLMAGCALVASALWSVPLLAVAILVTGSIHAVQLKRLNLEDGQACMGWFRQQALWGALPGLAPVWIP